MNDTWNSDDIDKAKAELLAAGWVEKTSTIWKSPSGKLHVGPAGAWRVMKRAQNDSRTNPMSDDGADARRHAETFQWAKDRSREALKARGYEPNALQLAFRGGFYDSSVVELAICDALVEQGGITAWPGDGVGCVAQMITAQAQRAEKAEAELDARRVAPVEPLRDVLAFVESHIAPFIRAGDEYERGWHAAMHNVRNRLLEARRVAAPPEGTLNLSAFIEKWTREADGYVAGAMFESPVGDMNRASAAVVRRMLADLRRAAAGVHPPQERT